MSLYNIATMVGAEHIDEPSWEEIGWQMKQFKIMLVAFDNRQDKECKFHEAAWQSIKAQLAEITQTLKDAFEELDRDG